jgi:preprotein translocase SecE subunit
MAVAVKNAPDVSSGLLDRMAAVSLAGTVYVLGSIGVVFYLLPYLWWTALNPNSSAAVALLGLAMVLAGGGLAFVGGRLLGPRAAPGVRAGIFMGLVGFLLVLLLTRWASLWVEYWVYDADMFGTSGPTAGPVVTGVIGLVFLALLLRLFWRPGFERWLVRFENQGWFSAKSYKRQQGLRVRRGTIFGILVLVAAGIYTLLTHGTLTRGPKDWALNIPFTGRYVITSEGDAGAVFDKLYPGLHQAAALGLDTRLVLSREALKGVNAQVDPANFVKIYDTGGSKYQVGDIVPKSDFDAEARRLRDEGLPEPHARPPVPASGDLVYGTLTLLPSLRYTVPLLLLAASLWLAWRIVNMPTFADFLIATEAELNKVSWTTQRRLVQDTIVVLATVVLLAGFLFAMDQAWRVLLSWKPIGVLQLPPEDEQNQNTNVEQRPW